MNNKPSTYATLFTSTSDEARTFDKWFYEREMGSSHPESSEPSVESGDVDLKELERTRGDYDGNIAVGQVRILSKRFTETPEVVPFVVVLEKWEDRGGDEDMWLVAPFSPYSTPATSGEMASGVKLLWREVIQAWNSRTLQESLLKKSFLCGELCGKTVREASALFRNQFAGTALPADFSAWRGSDVLLEFDPRRDYIAESIARLQPLATAVKATERARSENLILVDFPKAREGKEEGTILQPLYGSEEYRLAAGGKPMPTTEHFRIVGTELTLMYSPEEETAIFTFWDENDQPDPSYDGCSVLGTGGEFLGSFRNGTLSVPADSVKNWFQITDKNGNALKLVKE